MVPLQLKKAGSSWVVQSSSGSTPGLTCDPAKGTVAPLQSASQGADSSPVYGVIGVAQLTAGCALIVISAADQVTPETSSKFIQAKFTQLLSKMISDEFCLSAFKIYTKTLCSIIA